MLQYTFIFDMVRIEMPFRFIIILFVFLSHPIKIYHLSHSAPPFLPHHLLSPTLFSSPIFSFLLHTAIFLSPILPSTSSLPSLIYKNQVHRFFFPFSPFFFGSLLSVLWFVLVMFLSVSLVQLFFVCCWALLKAIYFTSFSFLVLELLLICVSMVSLWFILLGLLFCGGLFVMV